ncbi:MAG: SPASM domain-containing protein [Candidatus Heimdallarchaeota archaeon]
MYCSAKQGFYSAIDFDENIYPCYANESLPIGKIDASNIQNNTLVKKWNSKEFMVKEYNKEPCISCKYFFLCTARQCPFSSFDSYNDNLNYCIEFHESIADFITYMAKNIWKDD